MKNSTSIISLGAGLLCMLGVSCSSTTKSGSATGSSDDFYAGGATTNQGNANTNAYGEYDNIYDQNGVQQTDDYTGDNSSYTYDTGSTANNNSYSSNSGGNSTAAATPSSGRARYYTVQPGDNLYRIGLNHGVHWTSIQDANNIQGTTIRIGEQLVIPPR